MLINPQLRKKNLLFYNNICFIVCMFCVLCFFTGMCLQSLGSSKKTYSLENNMIVGPINVTDKSKIYKVKAHFSGKNSSSYISGEVLDENKDTLYEFGKDLWHEEGYDSEGHWSESERNMVVNLTFSEKGTYYLQFNTEEGTANNITVTIERQKGSYIVHLQAGASFMLLLLIIWIFLNRKWVKEKLVVLNDALEEMSEEDD